MFGDPLAQYCIISLVLLGLQRCCLDSNDENNNKYVRYLLSALLLIAASRTWRLLSVKEDSDDDGVGEVVEEEFVDVVVVEEQPILSPQDIPAFFSTLHAMHVDDRPFEAVGELERLRKASPQKFTAELPPAIQKMIQKIDNQRDEICHLTTLLEQESNWKFRMRHKNVDVFLSTMDGTDFKVVCECQGSDLFSIASIIYETDLYKHWVPGVNQSSRWKLSKLEQRLYLRFPLPFPMKDREVLLKGYGDVTNSGVMIYVQSVDSKEVEKKLGVTPGSALRCDVLFAGFLIKPLPNDIVQITMIARLDLKMPMLPDVMIDYASKFVLAELLVFIRDLSKGMREKPQDKKYARWLARQRGEDAKVYDEIKTRLAQLG